MMIPHLLLFSAVGILVIPAMVVLIVVVFAVWCALAVLLVAGAGVLALTGILSTSMLSAFITRRLSTGFRALYYQLFALATIPFGLLIVYYLLPVFGIRFEGWSFWGVSVAGSMIAGYLFALTLVKVMRLAIPLLVRKGLTKLGAKSQTAIELTRRLSGRGPSRTNY